MLQYANTFRYDTLPNCDGISECAIYTSTNTYLITVCIRPNAGEYSVILYAETYSPLVIYISTNSYVIIFWIRPNVREYSAIWYIEHWLFACKTTAAISISICGFDHNACRNICGSYNLRTAILVQICSYVIQMKYLDAQINSFNNASDFTNHWMDCIPMIPS